MDGDSETDDGEHLAVHFDICDPSLTDVSDTKDGGVLKKIIKEGQGVDTPFGESTVFVHYIGRLTDGTIFDSSRSRGEPYEFILGKGDVIKGWDQGIATMKKGEICELVCAADYAYGKRAIGAKIPPNATLVFQVELLDWQDKNVSPENDKYIERRPLKKGTGNTMFNDGAQAKEMNSADDASRNRKRSRSVAAQEKFEVKKILDKRTVRSQKRTWTEYLVQWKAAKYARQDSWEPSDGILPGCKHAVEAFEADRMQQPLRKSTPVFDEDGVVKAEPVALTNTTDRFPPGATSTQATPSRSPDAMRKGRPKKRPSAPATMETKSSKKILTAGARRQNSASIDRRTRKSRALDSLDVATHQMLDRESVYTKREEREEKSDDQDMGSAGNKVADEVENMTDEVENVTAVEPEKEINIPEEPRAASACSSTKPLSKESDKCDEYVVKSPVLEVASHVPPARQLFPHMPPAPEVTSYIHPDVITVAASPNNVPKLDREQEMREFVGVSYRQLDTAADEELFVKTIKRTVASVLAQIFK